MSPRGSPVLSERVFSEVTVSALSADSSKLSWRALCVDDINIFPGKNVGSAPEKDGQKKRNVGRGLREGDILPEGLLDIGSIRSHRFSAFLTAPQSHFQFIPGAFYRIFRFSNLHTVRRRIDSREYTGWNESLYRRGVARLGEARRTD